MVVPEPPPGQPGPPAAPDVPPRLASANKRFSGRSWALQRIDEWLAGDTSLLIITGDPGAGKSAMAAWLVGEGPPPSDEDSAKALARLRERWDAVHFCALQWERGSADPRHFAERLALQLADVPGFTAAALEALRPQVTLNQTVTATDSVVTGIGALTIQGQDTAEVFRTCVVAPLTHVMQRSPALDIVVLVDGLDEAASMPGHTVTDLLTILLSVPRVHLLIGTRRQSDVLDALDDGRALVSYLDLSAPELRAAAEEDLRAYVVDRFATQEVELPAGAVDDIVTASEGNFAYAVYLLDEVLTGARQATDLGGLPKTLNGLYESSLSRLREKHADTWEQEYWPLLGLVTVSFRGAPTTELATWAGVANEGVLIQRITQLAPVIVFDEAVEGWRLFHRSMAEFLSSRTAPRQGTMGANRWFVDPVRWHRTIADHYLAVAGGGSGWNAVADYGVHNVLQHLERAARLSIDVGERQEADESLASIETLLQDPAFHAEQQERARDENPYARDLRACVLLLLDHRPLPAVLAVLEVLARDPRPPVRSIAVEALVGAHERDPGQVRELLSRQLRGEPTEQGVALNAMRFLGSKAIDLFLEAASSSDESVRRATVIALYVLRRSGAHNVADEVMNTLVKRVRPSVTRSSRTRLEFLSDLSIAIYANNCESAEVGHATSELWRTVLKDRLHLGLVNQPFLEPLLKGVVAGAFARRVAETAWLADPGAGPQALTVPAEDSARVARVIPALDPGLDPATVEADLAALLRSPIPLLRVTAAMVLNVHAHVDLESTAALANRLFDQGSGEARLWTVLAFTTRLPEADAGWTEVVEGLTRRLVVEEPDVFAAPGAGAFAGFDITLVPLATAYADDGRPDLPLVAELLAGTDQADIGLRRRTIECLAPVGMAHPDLALASLQPVVADPQPELEDALVGCLSIVRVAHPELVDELLAGAHLGELRERVVAATDVQSVWRYVWWLGLYKNAVHQAVHYPLMRRELLQGGLQALVEARTARAFLSRFTSVVLRMVREADYELIRWTGP